MVYAISLAIIILAAVCCGYNNNKKLNKIIFLVASGIVLFCLYAFRDASITLENTPIDVNRYYENYKLGMKIPLNDFIELTRFETGYDILVWTLGRLFPFSQFILIFHALVIVIPVLIFIYKESKDVYLSTILFVTLGNFGFAMTGFRQSMAISIGLFAFMYAKRKKLIPYLIFCFLALLLHKSAIVLFVIYAFNFMPKDPLKNVLMYIAIAILFTFVLQFTEFFNEFLGYDYIEESPESGLGGILRMIIYAITLILLFMVLVERREREQKKLLNSIKVYYYSYFMGMILYLLRYIVLVFERVSFYFIRSMYIVFTPNIIDELKDRNLKIILRTALIILSSILFLYSMSSHQIIEFNYIIG